MIVGVSQGFFLALTLQLLPNKNKVANLTLTFFLILASLTFIVRLLPFRFSEVDLRFGIIADATIFLFGPLLYCYFRQVSFKEKPEFHLKWIHFLPFFLNLLFFGWALFFTEEELIKFIVEGDLNIMFFLVEFGGIISLSFYLVKSYMVINSFKRKQEYLLSFNQKIIGYLNYLLIAISIFTLLWAFTFINLYLFNNYSTIINYTTMWLTAPVFIFLIGFYSITQPNIFRVPIEFKEKKKQSRLKAQEIKELKEKLDKLILEDQIYSEPHLSLNSLSEILGTTTNNLSWLLNQVYKKSFYEFINQYRIVDFLEKIKKNQHAHKTILALAMESGFNSKSTFNKAFKSIMKDTPSNYIKNKYTV